MLAAISLCIYQLDEHNGLAQFNEVAILVAESCSRH